MQPYDIAAAANAGQQTGAPTSDEFGSHNPIIATEEELAVLLENTE